MPKHVHGHGKRGAETATYFAWGGMIQRCTNPRHPSYEYYGARGIKVCERWRVFTNFLADMGEKPSGLTLERLDNDGNYEPGNCCWATPAQQKANRRCSLNVQGRPLKDVCAETGVKYVTAKARIKRGWTLEAAAGV